MKRAAIIIALTSCWILVSSCTGDDPVTVAGSPDDAGSSSTDGASAADGAGDATNTGNDASPACPNGTKTTLTGVVHDPSSTLPIYNAIVYVPSAAVGPIAPGVTGCERCGAPLSGGSVVAALTDPSGRFTLENVPVGASVPLVVQLGKWRRQAVVKVDACVANSAPDAAIRLPKNGGEGDLPHIAATTGAGDALPCLLRKIGLDATEFTNPDGTGHVHLYAGGSGATNYAGTVNGGAAFPTAASLWASVAAMKSYDIAVFSCEGGPPAASAQTRQYVADYLAAGGRLMLQHYHSTWLSSGPASLPLTGTFDPALLDLDSPQLFDVDSTFPKGQAFADWLSKLPSAKPLGKISITAGQHNIIAAGAASQSWVHASSPTAGGAPANASVQLFTANFPVGGDPSMACGRIAMTDIHASGGDNGSAAFPDGCTTSGFTEQERALAFSLFDLSSCIQSDAVAPKLP